MVTKEFTKQVSPSLFSFLEEDPAEFLGMMADHADEVEFIRLCLKKLGIAASHPLCFAMWRKYSIQSSAGWLSCYNETEVINEAKRILARYPD